MIAATYSRYSSDNQRETSIEDQERLQAQRAASEGVAIGLRYSDREISAATPMKLREGGRAMLAAAERGDFAVLIIESLDRCWRDIVDQERTIRRLEFMGVRIIGVSDGYDTRLDDRELQRGVRGILNQQYLRDLAKKTHRGLSGQVIRGGHAGGLSFGYRSIEAGAVHRLVVDDAQAEWVRWIFARYAREGWSCQRIAAELNQRGVPTGRGGTWAVSAIYGSPAKGSGVLNNALYAGQYVWNRSQWVKDPDTGKRLRLVRPKQEWLIEAREDLRIVDDELWRAVRARMDGQRLTNGSKGKGARPRTLLGGLLTCGKCGGAVVAVSASAYGCAAHKDRGSAVCSGVRASRQQTDRRLLSVIREDLLQPAAIVELRQRVQTLMASQHKQATASAMTAHKRRAELDKEIARLVDAIASIGHSDALTARLKTAEAQRTALDAPAPIAAIGKIDDLMARYKRELANIEAALAQTPEQARAALGHYFGGITIEEDADATWAVFSASPEALLLKASGDSGSGCGGAQTYPESRRVRLK